MRLRQVLRNLLSNAIKFTESGRVRLHIARSESDVIAFSVADSGIGIPQEKQRLIFEAFQQADGSTSRKYGGTGLGLAISREIAGLLGGDLRVDSVAGQGSTFTLYLPTVYQVLDLTPEPTPSRPLTVDVTAPAPRRAIADDYEQLAERTILVVDDDLRNIFALTSLLESQKMNVVYAENGTRALAKLEGNSDIDVVLMDIMMPEMDGYEALRLIRQRTTWKELPVIALT